jgi:F0F1-type ATP synthase membrane subunit b/b'
MNEQDLREELDQAEKKLADTLDALANVTAERDALRAKLNAVPVKAIRRVCYIAESDAGDDIASDVHEWLGEFTQDQEQP